MSLKTLGLSIVIGSMFTGAKAFASSQHAVSSLGVSLKKLNDQKTTLRVDSKEFAVALKKIQITSEAIKKLKLNSEKLNDIQAGRDKFKSQVVDNMAMGATVAVPIKLAIDFESSMAGVRKVLDFKNDGEFKTFTQDILKMSTQMPVTADGLSQIAAAGGSLGVAKKDILEFTRNVGIMSVAFDMSAEDAGDNMGKLMNIYHLSLKGVSGLGDTINALDADMAAKSRDIVNVVARIGGTADVFGLTSNAASGLSAAFLALGKPPEVAATGINALLLKLATAPQQGKKFQQALGDMGLSATGLKKSIDKDAKGALTDFLHTLAKVDKTKQMGILSNLFGAEYADDIAVLVRGIDQYDKAMSISGNTTANTGSMLKEFQIQSATTKNKLTTLTNSVGVLGINLGTVLLPGLIAITDPLRDMSIKMGELSTKHETATTIIGGTVAGVVGLTLALSVAGYAISFAQGGLLRLSSALALTEFLQKRVAISTALATAQQWLWNIALGANPIGLLILGVSTLIGFGVVLYNNFKPFADMINGIANTVAGWFGFSPNIGVSAKTTPVNNPLTVKAPMVTKQIPANNYNATKVPTIPTGGGRYGNASQAHTTNINMGGVTVRNDADIQAIAKAVTKEQQKSQRDVQDRSYGSGGRR